MSLITKGPVGNPDLRRVATVDSVTVSLFANKYYFTPDLTNRYRTQREI